MTEMPTTKAPPISPLSPAKIAAKHPNPPPNTVPIARFIPLLSVAPARTTCYTLSDKFNLYIQIVV